jgi:hypothetical protein
MTDEPLTRPCTKCEIEKPLAEFSAAPRGKYGRKASCKECDALRHSQTYAPVDTEETERRRAATYEARWQGAKKTCRLCEVEKDRSEFYASRSGKFGRVLKSSCKDCDTAAVRAWYAKNSDQSNTNRRRLQLKQVYGLSVEQYAALLAAQDSVCAICRQPERAVHGTSGTAFGLSVDHCHDNSVVRGLLCQRCNRAIGLLGDDVELLRSAIAYLLNPPARGLI